jgi:hypothetical protein
MMTENVGCRRQPPPAGPAGPERLSEMKFATMMECAASQRCPAEGQCLAAYRFSTVV